MRSDIFLFCIICWLVFVPSQNTGASANQSPRSSHAECTCKIRIHIKTFPCFRSQKCGVCFKFVESLIRTTNRSWSRETSFFRSVEFLQGSPWGVGRVAHTWAHSCYRAFFLSLPFRIFNDRLLQFEGGEVDVVNGGAKVFEELGKSDFDARGGIHPAWFGRFKALLVERNFKRRKN